MRKKNKKLTLNQAARKMAAITQKYLGTLPQKEKEKRIKAFQSVVNGVSSSAAVGYAPADIPSKSKLIPHTRRSQAYGQGPQLLSKTAACP